MDRTKYIIEMNEEHAAIVQREWRWFFIKRAAADAHPQMREIVCPMLQKFRDLIPGVFDDV